MPVRVVTGFEHGVDNLTSLTKGNTGNKLFDTAVGTPTMSFAATRTGSRGLLINPSAATEGVGWTTSTIGASQNRVLLAFAIRFPTAIPTADCELAILEPTGSNCTLYFRNDTDKFHLAIGAIGDGIDGPTVAADTWYWIEIRFDTSGTTQYIADWWVNGTQQTQETVSAAAADTIGGVKIGTPNTAGTYTAHFDDVVVVSNTAAVTAPIGQQKVVLLTPDTGGTTTEIGTANATARFTTNSTADATHNSANILAATSEFPPLIGSTATGICQRTSGTGNACSLPMTSYTLQTGESVTGLRILIVGWAASATTNNLGMRVFNGTTERILFAAADPNFDNNTTSPAWLCKMATESPGAVTDFDTQTELDALLVRLGYSADVNPLPGAHVVYAELAVTEAAAGVALDGKAEVVVGVSGDVGMAWALNGNTNAVVDTSGFLDVAKALDGTANVVVDTTGTLDVAKALDGTTNAVVELTGDLTVSAGGPVALDGVAEVIVETSGSLDLALLLSSSTNAVVELTGSVDVVRALDGTSDTVVDATGALDVALALVSAAEIVVDATAELTVVPAGVEHALEGQVELIFDVDDSNIRWRHEPHGGGPFRGSGPRYGVRAGWG